MQALLMQALFMRAYQEMADDMRQYQITRNGKNTPLAMTILAWDKEIILASSQKGPNSFSYGFADTEVRLALQRCHDSHREGPSGADARHKMQGKCGEEMASHLYYLFNKGRPLGTRGAVVGTMVADNTNDPPEATDPCGVDGEVGS